MNVLLGIALAAAAPDSPAPASPDPEPSSPPSLQYTADGDMFTRYEAAERVFAAVDEANLRATPDAKGQVVAKLYLGTPVVITEVGEAVATVGTRNDLWYKVKTEPYLGQAVFEGYLFGSTLTPIRVECDFTGDGKPEVILASLLNAETYRLLLYDPAKKATLKDPIAFTGPALSYVQVTVHPTPLPRLKVVAASEDVYVTYGSGKLHDIGSEEPTALRDGFVQIGNRALRLRKGQLEKRVCVDGCAEPVYVGWKEAKHVLNLPEPQQEEGPDRGPYPPTACFMVGALGSGKQAPKVIACEITFEDGKTGGPSRVVGARYVKTASGWEYVMASGSSDMTDEVNRLLAQRGIQVQGAYSGDTTGLVPPETLYGDDSGKLTFIGHFPHSVETDRPVFHTYELGPVYGGNPFFIPRPLSEGGYWAYAWQPALDSIQWSEGQNPGHDSRYVTGSRECNGGMYLDVVTHPRKMFRKVGEAGSLEILRPKREHSAAIDGEGRDLLTNAYGRSFRVNVGESAEAYLAGAPHVYTQDPWGRMVRLTRSDHIGTSMCEPVLYVYRDDRQPVQIDLGSGIEVWTSDPPLRAHRWTVLGSATGEVELVDGGMRPHLFWEGRYRAIPFPPAARVVARAEVRRVLREEVVARGLLGREVDDFLRSWAPVLEESPYVAIAFHEGELIDDAAPTSISPPPDAFIRVLLDFMPLKQPATFASPAPPRAPPARGSFTVVEWGGLRRPER